MKMKFSNLSVLAVLALLAGTVEKAHAIPPNSWINLGTSPGGGYIIVGNSAPTDLGILGPATSPVFLSAQGSDIITLNAGNTATNSGTAPVIDMEAPKNTFNNYGSVNSTNNNAYGVLAGGANTLINNWGSINGEYAVGMGGNSSVFNNWGIVTSPYSSVYLYGQNQAVNNWGLFTSGSYAVLLYGTSNVVTNWNTFISTYDTVYEDGTNNTLNNHATISSTGASGQYGVYSDGYAFTLNNWGSINVETSGEQAVYADGGNFTFNNYGQVMSAGDGVDIYAAGNVINNRGSITSDGDGIYVSGTSNVINNWGSITSTSGDGIYFYYGTTSPNNIVNNWGTISASDTGVELESHSVLNNWGTINADTGVELYDSHNTFNNWGKVIGGEIGVYSDDAYDVTNNYGMIIATGTGVYINYNPDILNNYSGAVISGGGYGLQINDNLATVNNWGSIVSSSSGTAVYLDSNYQGNVINNWGLISSNGGAEAVNIESHDDVLNLNGHSSVIGKITVSGSNDVVNLNFTGLNRLQMAALKSSLIAQGANSGTATNVQFTLRGVHYNIDPAIVNVNLSSYQAQALTPNQAAVGASLDSLAVSPAPGTPLFNTLNAIDASGNVPLALGQLSPQKFQIFGDIAFANANFNSLQIDQRLNNLRDGSESIDTTGIGGGSDQATAGFDKDGKDGKGVIQTKSEERRWGFFASGDVLHANVDARDGLQNAKFTTAGLVLGVDGKINDNWVLGGLFSYQRTSSDLDAQGSKANIDSFGGGVYTGYHNGGWYGNGLATYTRNNYDTTRVVAFPGFGTGVNGSTNGNQFGVNLDGGYDFNLNQSWTAGPLLGLQYTHLGVDSFTESGATGANLAMGSQDVDSLRSRLGFRLAYHKQIGKEVGFAAEARAAWQHEFLDDSRGISASFAGSGLAPFSVQTTSPERDAALLGAGVNLTVRNRMTIFADYDVQVGQKSYFEQSVRGGLKFAW